MSRPYFFTDSDRLPIQDPALSFGSTGPTEYRLTSSFSGGGAPHLRAYAVCRGTAFIQEVEGQPDLVNLILKPMAQPNLHYTRVEYFVYRGLRKQHFLEGSSGEVIPDSSSDKVTDLMTRMWKVRHQLNADRPSVDPSFTDRPLTRADLGLHELTDSPLDGDTLITEVFDHHVFQPMSAGAYLGEFDSTVNHGFEIMLARKQHRHILSDVRSLEHTLEITYGTGQSRFPDPEDISTRSVRERILGYMDPAAWYGLLAEAKVKVNRSGSVEALTAADCYEAVLMKFASVDHLYVDIRNELNDSFNYLEEYGTGTAEVQVGDGAGAFMTREYHDGNGWPVLVLKNTDFEINGDESHKLPLQLPQGDNPNPLLYLNHARLFDEFPKRRECYAAVSLEQGWSDAVELGISSNPTASAIYPGGVQVVACKRIDVDQLSEGSSSDLFVKQDLLDNLLAPGMVHLEEKADFVGWTSLKGGDFMVTSGAARDGIGEIAFCYRSGPPEINGETGHGRSMADLNLEAGLQKSASFFHMLRDHLSLIRFGPRAISATAATAATEIACVQVDSVHDNLSIDPFNQSAEDLIVLAYAESERSEILDLIRSEFWDEAPGFFVALDKTMATDEEDLVYFRFELGIQGVQFDSASRSHAVDVAASGTHFYSVDGRNYFSEAYAAALNTLMEE